MNIPKFSILFLLSLSLFIGGYGQSTRITSGESMIKVESFMSQIEAEDKAMELAKIDALIKEFGQYVEQQSNLELQSGKVDFRSYGQTKVRGEWIRTIGEPDFEYLEKPAKGKPENWIRCKLKGEVRKAFPKADLEVEVLSCPKKDCVTEKFKNDQDIYLYVKSPIDGFLSIFLDDGTNVYRLLPYRNMSGQKAVNIVADKEYILFSKENNRFEQAVDALQVYTNREIETNTIVVVFSENQFSKPRLNDETVDAEKFIIPRSLTKKYFENWLGENRAAFPDFLDLKRRISITSK